MEFSIGGWPFHVADTVYSTMNGDKSKLICILTRHRYHSIDITMRDGRMFNSLQSATYSM